MILQVGKIRTVDYFKRKSVFFRQLRFSEKLTEFSSHIRKRNIHRVFDGHFIELFRECLGG